MSCGKAGSTASCGHEALVTTGFPLRSVAGGGGVAAKASSPRNAVRQGWRRGEPWPRGAGGHCSSATRALPTAFEWPRGPGVHAMPCGTARGAASRGHEVPVATHREAATARLEQGAAPARAEASSAPTSQFQGRPVGRNSGRGRAGGRVGCARTERTCLSPAAGGGEGPWRGELSTARSAAHPARRRRQATLSSQRPFFSFTAREQAPGRSRRPSRPPHTPSPSTRPRSGRAPPGRSCPACRWPCGGSRSTGWRPG